MKIGAIKGAFVFLCVCEKFIWAVVAGARKKRRRIQKFFIEINFHKVRACVLNVLAQNAMNQ